MKPSPIVAAYERAFAEAIGVPRAFAFWKGRVALYAILKGLGIGEGDEVIITGYTCVMAVNPIIYLGAKPVFVDIEPVTYNIDPALIEPAITAKTRLIIAQHTYGYPADMRAIMDISRRRGIPVVEDCCLALGSRYDGRLVGTFGIASYFSSQWNKPYTTGLGGMAAMNDLDLARKVESICEQELVAPTSREVNLLRAQLGVYRATIYPKTTAMAQMAFRFLTRTGLVVGSSSPQELHPQQEPDFFKAMSDVQARAGLRQLGRLEQAVAHRKSMTILYTRLLSEAGFPVPSLPAVTDAVLVRYPVRVASKERALAGAARRMVELGSWFECPLHPIETPLDAYGYHAGMCPESERASAQVVNLPLHPRASASTARRSVAYLGDIGPPVGPANSARTGADALSSL